MLCDAPNFPDSHSLLWKITSPVLDLPNRPPPQLWELVTSVHPVLATVPSVTAPLTGIWPIIPFSDDFKMTNVQGLRNKGQSYSDGKI